MKAHIINRYVFTALILIFSSELFATAATDYEQGVAAYKAGDNASAVTYFESALKQGMDSISLKYNLASSYYKVGRYEEAKRYFKLLNKTLEMRDIAEYHLGVIAVKEKDRVQAQGYFSSVVNSGKDEKLVKLSNKYLRALVVKEDRWKSRLSLNLGYDDNISSVSEDSVLDTADSFYELSASSNLLIDGSRKNGWLADVAVYGIAYSDIDTNDQHVIVLGVERAMQFAGWDTGAHLSVSDITYGGDDLQTVGQLNFRGRKTISKNQWFNMRYRFEDIKSDQSIYDYLEGWRQRISFEYQNLKKNHISLLQYEYELNNRGELVTSIGTYDYSPTRHTVRGIYTHFINKQWWLTGDISYRFSDFEVSETLDRDDDQWMFGLSTDYRFDKTFKLTAKYQFTDNTSTIDVYSYDKSVIRVGISKMF
ncbi:MAG: tetratricopeptide repeat protein [Gammaproteobacteria bacterium]|nr:tetratricopeptide repeat protein [Gammaproteobacteria bacterium]